MAIHRVHVAALDQVHRHSAPASPGASGAPTCVVSTSATPAIDLTFPPPGRPLAFGKSVAPTDPAKRTGSRQLAFPIHPLRRRRRSPGAPNLSENRVAVRSASPGKMETSKQVPTTIKADAATTSPRLLSSDVQHRLLPPSTAASKAAGRPACDVIGRRRILLALRTGRRLWGAEGRSLDVSTRGCQPSMSGGKKSSGRSWGCGPRWPGRF
jgi:hypothetical protein